MIDKQIFVREKSCWLGLPKSLEILNIIQLNKLSAAD